MQTANEKLVVPVDEIEELSTSLLSVMPDGLLQQLSMQQVMNLIAYLESPQQVPLPEIEPIKE